MLAVSTWNFGSATAQAWKTLQSAGSAIDAVEQGSDWKRIHNGRMAIFKETLRLR
jgi:hypothetical protein